MTQLFQSAIQRIIPHRYPFLLVDRVTEFHEGESIVGFKNFTVNEGALEASSPALTFVPVGLVLEAVTQLGAILVLERPQMAGKIAVILHVPMARMLRPVVLGETLRLEARVVKMKENFGELRGLGYVGEELVAEGQMRFGITDAATVASALAT